MWQIFTLKKLKVSLSNLMNAPYIVKFINIPSVNFKNIPSVTLLLSKF